MITEARTLPQREQLRHTCYTDLSQTNSPGSSLAPPATHPIPQEVAEPLQDLKEGMDQLEKNKTLRYILSTLLAIGNFLNGSSVSDEGRGAEADWARREAWKAGSGRCRRRRAAKVSRQL